MNVLGELSLNLTPMELAGTIEGLRGSLGRRLLMVYTDHVVRGSDIEDFQASVGAIGSAYQKAMFVARAEGMDAPDINVVTDLMIDDKIWKLYDKFLAADDWDDVPPLGRYPWEWTRIPHSGSTYAKRLIQELAEIL